MTSDSATEGAAVSTAASRSGIGVAEGVARIESDEISRDDAGMLRVCNVSGHHGIV
jgi:hypothetical protein